MTFNPTNTLHSSQRFFVIKFSGDRSFLWQVDFWLTHDPYTARWSEILLNRFGNPRAFLADPGRSIRGL